MNAEAIFDSLIAAVGSMARADSIRSRKQRILELKRRECGNCDRWMKSTCRPEKEQGIFKSMSGSPCCDFERKQRNIKFIQELEKELEEFISGK